MDYQVVLSGSSRKDLEDIVRYISLDDPTRALQFGKFLIHHTRGLAQFPERGRVVPEFGDDTIREIISTACSKDMTGSKLPKRSSRRLVVRPEERSRNQLRHV